jgi:hypothetical protein
MKAVVACIALLLVLLSALPPRASAENLGRPFCDALRNAEHKVACLDYIDASSSISKWTSAVRWSKHFKESCRCHCIGQPVILAISFLDAVYELIYFHLSSESMHIYGLYGGLHAVCWLSCCCCRPMCKRDSPMSHGRYELWAGWLVLHLSSSQHPL